MTLRICWHWAWYHYSHESQHTPFWSQLTDSEHVPQGYLVSFGPGLGSVSCINMSIGKYEMGYAVISGAKLTDFSAKSCHEKAAVFCAYLSSQLRIRASRMQIRSLNIVRTIKESSYFLWPPGIPSGRGPVVVDTYGCQNGGYLPTCHWKISVGESPSTASSPKITHGLGKRFGNVLAQDQEKEGVLDCKKMESLPEPRRALAGRHACALRGRGRKEYRA